MNKSLPAVQLVPSHHNGKPIIRIDFNYDAELVQRVKLLPQAAWSRTLRCWYVPDTEAYRRRFKMEVKAATAEVKKS